MEASKLLIDSVVYFTLCIIMWGIKDTYDGQVNIISKIGLATAFAFVVVFTWIYTYATIGLDLAELVARR